MRTFTGVTVVSGLLLLFLGAVEPAQAMDLCETAASHDDPNAVAYCDEAVHRNPHDALARASLARLKCDRHQYEECLSDYTFIIENYEKDYYKDRGPRGKGNLLEVRGEVFFRKGDLERALADFNSGLLLSSDNIRGLDFRGLVYLKLGQLDQSIAAYDVALKQEPNFARSLYGRGLAKNRRRAGEGDADISAAITADPNIAQSFAADGIK
jgi:tetratricopeptide (TPR) repeat protein